ncbi:hypothetical protein [Pseudomonas sp. S36]|uniref:hypothetical protein n=1 Tax=Pseudomonas sp. S36 TaxID=2767447 RepID=UPI001912321D|nr:hypothetical protein [Pseudomonas sp. S36]MBK4989446.1 hypothetical protein [Pseudomonas sp. S36]
MLVKIQDMDASTVDVLKGITGKKTASGAVETAALAYIAQRETIAHLRANEAKLTARLEAAERTIQGARAAASELLERTGQLI